MGFREVLCVSFAAALGIWGTSFPHDQYSDRFTSRAKACSAWIWISIYIFIYLFYYLCIHFIFFFRSLLPLSMCFFLSACGIATFWYRGCHLWHVFIRVALYDVRGLWLHRDSEVWSETPTTHGSICMLDRTAWAIEHSGKMAVVQGGSTEASAEGRVWERSNKLTRSASVFDVDWALS